LWVLVILISGSYPQDPNVGHLNHSEDAEKATIIVAVVVVVAVVVAVVVVVR
jgi:hypothetical protein